MTRVVGDRDGGWGVTVAMAANVTGRGGTDHSS